MPRESTNLKLKLYNALTDATEFAINWFNDIFDYSNSNWVKIDTAYKELKDTFNNHPLNNGTGANGTWDINITGSANSANTATDSTNATNATNDSNGQKIDETYIKGVEPNKGTIVITRGDNKQEVKILETDKTLTIEGMPADAKATGEFIKKSIYPTLVVSTTVGSSVTVTKDEYSFTEIVGDSGEAEFSLPSLGEWKISATLNDKNAIAFINIDTPAKKYNIRVEYFSASLIVYTEAGAVVTAISENQEYTETANSSGVATFNIKYAGNYSVSAKIDRATSSTSYVNITTHGESYSTTVAFITITVSCDSGSSISVKKDSEYLTGTSSGRPVKFYIPSIGSWVVTATLDSDTAQQTVVVSRYKDYPVVIVYHNIFGVVWDYSNSSTKLSRITRYNDPNNYVNTNITASPSPAVGTGSGSSPFDDYMPWKGMDEYNIVNNAIGAKRGESGFSRSYNDVMVYIPEFYYKVVNDSSSSKRYFYVADKATTGFEKHPGSGRYVGRYNTISNNYSRTGLSPYVSMTRAIARSGARNKGSKWALYDYASWCAVWLLYIVEYADWNSQSKIGMGWVNNHSEPITSGHTDSMTYHTGRASGTDGSTAVQYRHIENPWGGISEWIDGINFSNGAVYICTNISEYADNTSTNYTNIGTKAQSDGYISATGYSSISPWSFYPTSTSGSETTYIPDNTYWSNGWRVLAVGGIWNYGSRAGLFHFDTNNSSVSSFSSVGARLLFVP